MTSCPICGDVFDTKHGMKIHASRSHDTSLAGETTECDTCGKEITRQQYEIDKYDNHFCSDECETEWREERYSGEQNPNYDRVTLTCEHCKGEFDVPQHREETARFCSDGCQAEFQSENRAGSEAPAWEGGLATLTCDHCGDEYDVYPARADESRFCSFDCLGSAREATMGGENNPSWSGGAVSIECEYCGDEYDVTPAKARSSRFCSPECLGAHHRKVRSGSDSPTWRGGYEPYYGPNWREKRRQVLIRDQARCQDCGKTDQQSLQQHGASLEIHHQTPFREFRNDDEVNYQAANRLENLITLCKTCHLSRESRR